MCKDLERLTRTGGLDALSLSTYDYYTDTDITMIRGVDPDIDPHVKVIPVV